MVLRIHLKQFKVWQENEYVKFKLQLINANTNNVIGEYTVVTFTKDNIKPYFGESFSINTSGIGNKKVRVRFIAEENIKWRLRNGEYLCGRKCDAKAKSKYYLIFWFRGYYRVCFGTKLS